MSRRERRVLSNVTRVTSYPRGFCLKEAIYGPGKLVSSRALTSLYVINRDICFQITMEALVGVYPASCALDCSSCVRALFRAFCLFSHIP